MTHLMFDTPTDVVQLFRLALHLAAGVVLGVLYFGNLWWSVRRFTGNARTLVLIAMTISRLILLGGVLVLASLEGAMPLLLMAAGILVGRFAVMRRLRETAP